MSVDDPSAKDAVVLGADLVAALGFEPVVVDSQRPDSFRTVDPSHDGSVDMATAASIESADAATSVAVDDNAREEVTMSTETEAETSTAVVPPAAEIAVIDDLTVSDDPVVDELVIVDDPQPDTAPSPAPSSADAEPDEPDPAARHGRFGVRGRFNRLPETVAADAAVAEAPPVGSTAALFADEVRLANDAALTDAAPVDTPLAEPWSTDAAPNGSVPPPPSGDPISPWADGSPIGNGETTASLDLTDSRVGPTIDLETSGRSGQISIGEPAPVRPAVADGGLVSLDPGELALAPAPLSTTRLTGTKLRARKSRRVIRHIDPWSVLTFSILFHLAFFASLLLAGVLVWNAAIAAGTIENIENFIRELGDFETFQINSDQVFRAAVVIAGMLTLASSVLVVLLTVVFNLISDLIGGIRVTVIEEETVRVPAQRK